jgi:hypothetical protein
MRLYRKSRTRAGWEGILTLGVPDAELERAVVEAIRAEPDCEFFLAETRQRVSVNAHGRLVYDDGTPVVPA